VLFFPYGASCLRCRACRLNITFSFWNDSAPRCWGADPQTSPCVTQQDSTFSQACFFQRDFPSRFPLSTRIRLTPVVFLVSFLQTPFAVSGPRPFKHLLVVKRPVPPRNSHPVPTRCPGTLCQHRPTSSTMGFVWCFSAHFSLSSRLPSHLASPPSHRSLHPSPFILAPFLLSADVKFSQSPLLTLCCAFRLSKPLWDQKDFLLLYPTLRNLYPTPPHCYGFL